MRSKRLVGGGHELGRRAGAEEEITVPAQKVAKQATVGFSGRCPGLICCAPSGRRINMPGSKTGA